jgi:hydrogenase 3 maturation protease
LGVGSELRADDAAGVLVATELEKRFSRKKRFRAFVGHTAPENLTGEIKRFKPTHLVIVDSAEIGNKPGDIALIEIDNLAGVSFCTHQLPVKVMADYLWQSVACEMFIIGIRPASLAFGQKVSPVVKKSVRAVVSAFEQVLND